MTKRRGLRQPGLVRGSRDITLPLTLLSLEVITNYSDNGDCYLLQSAYSEPGTCKTLFHSGPDLTDAKALERSIDL